VPVAFDPYFRRGSGVVVNCLTWGPPSRVLVEWALVDTQEDLSAITFSVERSEDSAFSAFSTLTSGRVYSDPHEFVDSTAPFESLHRKLYYRVRASRVGDPDVVSAGSTWHGNADLVGQEIVARHTLLVDTITGSPFVYWKQRTFGPRCPRCYDPISKRSKKGCTQCLGTGFVHPYHDPVGVWLDKDVPQEMLRMTQFSQQATTQRAVWRPMYPMFSAGDVLLEAQNGDRYKVESRKVVAEKRGVPIQQVLILELMPRSSVTSLLKVSDAVVRGLVDTLVSERELREF
jgi:hypothetical protein